MIQLTGKGVYGAVAVGDLRFVKRDLGPVVRRQVEDCEAEYERFQAARDQAVAELGQLQAKALAEAGEQSAAVFEVHQMMLRDEDYCDNVRSVLASQRVNAEFAVSVTGANFAAQLSELDDPYLRERAADVNDVSERVIRCLTGRAGVGLGADEPVIVVADDLSPSETVQLDKSKVLAFVTAGGSTNSHSAILARSLGIPAVVGVGPLDPDWDGEYAVVDGFSGQVLIRPDQPALRRLLEKKQSDEQRKQLLEELRGQPDVTLDGRRIEIHANIGSTSELAAVRDNDAGGVGLFRTEFAYMEAAQQPSEDELFEVYRQVAQELAPKRVVFRTLDVGADKQIAYLDLPQEDNPALGLRGVRLCLRRPDVFHRQLRALLRASAFGRVALMAPMIASLSEVQRVKALLAQIKAELLAEGCPVAEPIEFGVMVETPAAAICSDRLAPEVDFFSIGTNDLTQYTLAVDRQNLDLEEFCDPRHEAVLRLIGQVVDNGHRHGAWVGICGELAGDLSLTEHFLRLGVDELSVAPTVVLPLRQRVRELDLAEP
ncbi:MAG: phosphoenolpyruvate--protein phosphotransferase [Propionibacteriaceae bacterium]|nr:phosphoenolpyruvate--protein phosphotransferase [Propionibacteriaceae bacterium]